MYGPNYNWVPHYRYPRRTGSEEHRKESLCKEKAQTYKPTTKRVIRRVTTIVEEIDEVES